MVTSALQGQQRPKKLIHATYSENIYGIQRDGLIPAQNPKNADRQPLRALLQGAEDHVNTVNPEVLPGSRRPSADGAESLVESIIGLERVPDVLVEIDVEKADKRGIPLDLVQSDRVETVLAKGTVSSEFLRMVPNYEPSVPRGLKAKYESFDEVPIINLSSDRARVVEQLRHACEVVGFMQIVGHGIDPALLQQHEDFQRRFFALPQDVKTRLALNAESPVRGYFGRGGEDLDDVLLTAEARSRREKAAGEPAQSRKDNKEALDMNGVPWSRPVGGNVAHIFGQQSRLPTEDELPGFADVMEKYNGAMFQLGQRLLKLMALVLGQPEDLFEEHLTRPVATSRILHYYPITDYSKQIGVGEHTDYGLLTPLKQDSTGGLNVLNAKDSEWVHATPIDGAFVVNIGDMLERWSNYLQVYHTSSCQHARHTPLLSSIFHRAKHGDFDRPRWPFGFQARGWRDTDR